MSLSRDVIARLPKVALHEHLDGALRPSTVVELAREVGHDLPTTDPDALGRWFFQAADSGSLVRYLQTFEHTVACMQSAENLRRVAREFVEDQAADGVVYVEARWAPSQHQREGLTIQQAVEAVRDGLADGMASSARAGRHIVGKQIVTSMRHEPPRDDVAQLAIDYADDSVCGFDLAGPEAGFPPSAHASSFALVMDEGVPFTIHAGEAAGIESIRDAVGCGAWRLGHGVRLIDEVQRDGDAWRLGETASYVRNKRITLEVCPTSNVQTGVCASIADHPFGVLAKAGFRLSVSCDNRLMSGTTLTDELTKLSHAFGYGLAEVRAFTLNAMRAAFCGIDERQALIDEVIVPGFARAGE